jgi:hypothetical protein
LWCWGSIIVLSIHRHSLKMLSSEPHMELVSGELCHCRFHRYRIHIIRAMCCNHSRACLPLPVAVRLGRFPTSMGMLF